ncbi:MAG TPA: VOC family protein [Mycobacteriales bacterium]|nr:VOC family protein [Mycobacteriales bacterium]
MKTIFAAYRVSDPERSLQFYTSLGYRKVGAVEFDDGTRLLMLRFPEEPATTLELVYRPGAELGGGLDHLAVEVDSLADTLSTLAERGLAPGPIELPGGPDGPKTAELIDPDGYRIELVEWPPGQTPGITDADFQQSPT